jgi:hypothetical protein
VPPERIELVPGWKPGIPTSYDGGVCFILYLRGYKGKLNLLAERFRPPMHWLSQLPVSITVSTQFVKVDLNLRPSCSQSRRDRPGYTPRKKKIPISEGFIY